MKSCFKCGLLKPLSEYYVHKQMADGHLNKCKECTKKDTKERGSRLKNNPIWIISERERSRDKYYRLYQGTKPPPELKKKYAEAYINKYPEKQFAKSAMGKSPYGEGWERHHWSYNPEHYLDYIVLDYKTHAMVHRYLIYDQPSKMYKAALTMELLDTKEKHHQFVNRYINEAVSISLSSVLM